MPFLHVWPTVLVYVKLVDWCLGLCRRVTPPACGNDFSEKVIVEVPQGRAATRVGRMQALKLTRYKNSKVQ